MSNSRPRSIKKHRNNRKKNTNLVHSSASIWPDGWFVSNGDEIKGPFSAEQVFIEELDFHAVESALLVSRKGFKKFRSF